MKLYNSLRKKHIPLHFSIDLTNRCNLNCIHCFRPTNFKNELSISELKKIINQLGREGCLSLTLTGGEPFLRKECFEIADFAKDNGFTLRFLSNGTSINKKNIKRLKSLNCELRITLYGATSQTHDSITQVKGSFEKTMLGIELLENCGITFNIAVVVINQNLFEIEKLQKMLIKKKWEFKNHFVVYPGNEDGCSPLKYRITDKQLQDAAKRRLLDREDVFSTDNEPEFALSDIGRLSGHISSCGKVYPSLFLRIEAGDLRKNAFRYIWNDSPQLNRLRGLKLKDTPCANCPYNLNCNRDLGSIQDENDGIAVASEWCRLIKIRKEVNKDEEK